MLGALALELLVEVKHSRAVVAGVEDDAEVVEEEVKRRLRLRGGRIRDRSEPFPLEIRIDETR